MRLVGVAPDPCGCALVPSAGVVELRRWERLRALNRRSLVQDFQGFCLAVAVR